MTCGVCKQRTWVHSTGVWICEHGHMQTEDGKPIKQGLPTIKLHGPGRLFRARRRARANLDLVLVPLAGAGVYELGAPWWAVASVVWLSLWGHHVAD